ncbi:AraC family transcriptional regulator [Anaerosporobacter sp.]
MVKDTSSKQAIERCITNKYFSVAYLCNEENTMDIHIHDCYEMCFCICGDKHFLIDNKFYDIVSGDLFVINQFESHYLTKINQSALERIVIFIHPDFIKTLSSGHTNLSTCFTNRTQGFTHRLHLTTEQQNSFHFYTDKITSVDSYGSDIIEKACFMELLVMINRIYIDNFDLNTNENDSKQEQPIEQIIQFINQNICKPITIEYLAKQFYLSDSYICRIFKSATGTTINKYITARRISIAKSLLSSGTSVSDVYSQSGFNDYSNFLKAFTKAVGVPPKKYALHSSS